MNTRTAEWIRNGQLDYMATQAANGYVRVFTAPQPATPETVITTQTLLAEGRLGSPAFASASGGSITANAISDDDSAAAGGVPAWFRVYASDGTTPLWDGDAGTSGANMLVAASEIVAGARVTFGSFTYTLPMQGV